MLSACKKHDDDAAARDIMPAKQPASLTGPRAKTAMLRTKRRDMKIVPQLLAHNA
jgi:hypothetical protein